MTSLPDSPSFTPTPAAGADPVSESRPLLELTGICVRFALRGMHATDVAGQDARAPRRSSRHVDALQDVSLSLERGGRLGIVGESGSGKSTLARVVLGLAPARAGQVRWCGDVIDYAEAARMRALRRELQVVFQDPVGSLDPRMNVGAAVDEALQALAGPIAPGPARTRVLEALAEVGLAVDLADRYPHQLSGGQCQRVAIARATIARPRLLVCDEAVSALDVSVQAQIVNLLHDLGARHGMALLFISHNLAVVRHLCDEVVVLREGRVIERGRTEAVFREPREPYTQALLAAVPEPDPAVQRARIAVANRARDAGTWPPSPDGTSTSAAS